MANRNTHKKLRAEIRSRMAITGESHQTALSRIRARRNAPARVAAPSVPDLVRAQYFGLAVTLAAVDVRSQLRLVLVTGAGAPLGSPLRNVFPFRVHTGGVQ